MLTHRPVLGAHEVEPLDLELTPALTSPHTISSCWWSRMPSIVEHSMK
jgi:hypothetical protein